LPPLDVFGEEARQALLEGFEPNADITPIEPLGRFLERDPFHWSSSAIRQSFVEQVATFIEDVEFQEVEPLTRGGDSPSKWLVEGRRSSHVAGEEECPTRSVDSPLKPRQEGID